MDDGYKAELAGAFAEIIDQRSTQAGLDRRLLASTLIEVRDLCALGVEACQTLDAGPTLDSLARAQAKLAQAQVYATRLRIELAAKGSFAQAAWMIARVPEEEDR